MTIVNDGDVEFTGTVRAPAFVPTSSRRFKENIQTLKDANELVAQLRGVSFNWKKTGKPSVGLIAEEVADVIPAVVDWEKDGQAAGLNYSALVGVLVEALKDQQKAAEQQQHKMEMQQAAIESLQTQLSEVEQLKTELRELRSQLLTSTAKDGANRAGVTAPTARRTE